MGELVLVRHAQAAFLSADYDRLSPLGRDQALALGRHFAEHDAPFTRVFVGPRRRHRETVELIARGSQERGVALPAPCELAELDEHAGLRVLGHALGAAPAAALAALATDPAGRPRIVEAFFGHYRRVMGEWARGALAVPDVESWAEFRARAARALATLCTGPGSAVAISSGGLISAAAGVLLGLGDEQVIELSSVLRNTALTEVRHSGSRMSLVSFNALPHLADPASATAV